MKNLRSPGSLLNFTPRDGVRRSCLAHTRGEAVAAWVATGWDVGPGACIWALSSSPTATAAVAITPSPV